MIITPVDLLVIGAHPDDQELSCGGTMLLHKQLGWSIGILDLTRGELGTRGTPEIRRQEALDASDYIGADWRVPLDLGDGFLRADREAQLQVVEIIRAARPRIILANAVHDRHIDHARGSSLAEEANFISGLRAIKTRFDNQEQQAYRAPAIYHYIQDYQIKPDFVIDITDYQQAKMELVLKYRSQFYNPDDSAPETPISGQDFLDFLDARAREMGRPIGATYGEGFTASRYLGVKSLEALV